MTLTESAVSTGTAPGGMWWVAWRQHRVQLLIAGGLMALDAVAMVIFRAVLVADLTARGCADALAGTGACPITQGRDVWNSYGGFSYGYWYWLLTGVALGLPVVLGIFLGAAIFPREFEQGTHVLALTQSVSRLRWWAVKVTVVGVPLVVGLLVLGFVKQWVDGSSFYTAGGALGTTGFSTRSIIPAALGLLVFALAVTIGILTRRTVVALVLSLILGFGVLVALLSPLRGYLVPAERVTTLFSSSTDTGIALGQYGRDSLWIDSGYVRADGSTVGYQRPANKCNSYVWDQSLSDDENNDAANKSYQECLAANGIVGTYQDIVPGTMVWPMRLIVTGIFTALSILILAAGAWRLRLAVAKR